MTERIEERAARDAPPASGYAKVALLLGGLAGLAVLLTLGQPGLTIDEPLDVRPGRDYLKILRSEGLRFFSPEVVERVFRDNAEHPPLGRWLLGLASTLGEPFQIMLRGVDPTGLYVGAGRLAPALIFACLAALVTWETSRRAGRAAGIAAGWSLLVMPRVFAHAHLGALDTFLSFFWTLALLAGARAFEPPGTLRQAAGAGLLWGLAILTKIHAWVLVPIMIAWAFARLPWRRAILALIAWSAAGISLFFVGWPWLWYHTWERLTGHLGTSIRRTTIMVEYFGQVFPDRQVPWHYPWVYFATTVPLGLHLLGAVGLAWAWKTRKTERFPWLLLGSIVIFLLIFSTNVPVYDGERLFLHVFPAWAILIGLGFGQVWSRWGTRQAGKLLLGGFLAIQAGGVVMLHPFGLSYYNLLVGGLPGAERLRLELTYWSDAIDGVLLDRLAEESEPRAKAAVVPTLYPGQGVLTTTARLLKKEIILDDEAAATTAEWLLVSRRTAYWKPEVIQRLREGGGRQVATRTRQGVWLSALWSFPRGSPKPR